MLHNVYIHRYKHVHYYFTIGTVDTPSLQGRIAARGDAEKVCVCACAHVCVCLCVRMCVPVMYVATYACICTRP